MQGPGRVGRDELDLNTSAGADPAPPVGMPLTQDLGYQRVVGIVREPEVDESGAGDLHPRDAGRRRQSLYQPRRKIARRHLGRLAVDHRRIGGEIAMAGITRPFDHRRLYAIGIEQPVDDELIQGL